MTDDQIPKPMHDFVVLRKKTNRITEGGIYVPDSSDSQIEAVVVAVGPGAYYDGHLVPTTLKPGDSVVLDNHAQHNISGIRLGKEQYAFIRERFVVAVLPPKDATESVEAVVLQ